MLRQHSANPLRPMHATEVTQINKFEPPKQKLRRQAKLKQQKKVWDNEALQFTIISLKKHINEIQDDNVKLKTKNSTLEKQNQRLKNYIVTGQSSGNYSLARSTLFSGNQREASLIINLKAQLRQAKATIKSLQEQNEILRKSVKYTNISEIQIEKKALLDESTRLKTIVGQLVNNQNLQLAYKKQAQSLAQQLTKKIEENHKMTQNLVTTQERLRQLEMQHAQNTMNYEQLQKRVANDMKIARLKIRDNIRREQVYKKHIDSLKKQSCRMAQTFKSKTEGMSKTMQVVIPPIKLTRDQPITKHQPTRSNQQSRPQQMSHQPNVKTYHPQQSQQINYDQIARQEVCKIGKKMIEEQEECQFDYEESEEGTQFQQRPQEQQQPQEQPPQQLQDIADLLRYRLQAQRYSLQQLSQDIDQSCPQTLIKPQILDVFQKQPFFLSSHQATIVTCWIFNQSTTISKHLFNQKLKQLIKSINIFKQQLENQIAQSILGKLQQQWDQIKKISDKKLSKQVLSQHLLSLDFTNNEIQLILNDLSLNSTSLNELNIMNLREIYVQEVQNTIQEEDEESMPSKHQSLISDGQYNQSDLQEYSNSYI